MFVSDRIFNIAEAKTHLSKIIDRVEKGEEITIARNNKPVAVISAARKTPEEIVATGVALRERIRARNGGRGVLEPGESWRDFVDEGRRF